MYAKLFELKNLIKKTASWIRETRHSVKEMQRNGQYAGSIQRQLCIESRHCRHLHIAYCLIRERAYESIEKPKQGNEPDWKIIENFKQEYANENVRTCA